MVEPVTALGTGLAVLGSKDVLTKLLGPTADYLGAEAAGLVEKCNINLDRVFLNAKKKLGNRLEQHGSVSPRILRHVVDDGRFCEDELVAEYYGGLLASSRTIDGKDDSGLTHLSRVKSMSVYQIRLHFFIYFSLARVFHGRPENIASQDEREKLRIFIPFPLFYESFGVGDDRSFSAAFAHAIHGLHAQGLIYCFSYGPVEHLQKSHKGVKEPGFWVEPTFLGAELFLWAMGAESPDGYQFLKLDLSSESLPIAVPEGAAPLESLKTDG